MDIKKILLFGANGGIGRAIQKVFKKNKKISLINFDQTNLDLSNTKNLDEQFKKIMTENLTGSFKINSIIYAAGVILDSKFENAPSVRELQEIFSVNTFSPILIHNLVQDYLDTNAKFIYLSSTATLGPNGLFPIYTTSKKASETFLKIQSKKIVKNENKFKKIICILPGPTNTPMRKKISNDATRQQTPVFIGKIIKEIILKEKYKNGNFIVAKNYKIEIL